MPDPDPLRAALRQAMVVCHVPETLHDGLLRFFLDRILPGGFLQAVLCNDLAEACRRADPFNSKQLAPIVAFLEQFAIEEAWGSPAKVLTWTVTPDRFELARPPHFTCPRCGAVSYNRNDITERYCGRCHTFLDDMPQYRHPEIELAAERRDGNVAEKQAHEPQHDDENHEHADHELDRRRDR